MQLYKVGQDQAGAVSYALRTTDSNDYPVITTDEQSEAIPTFNGIKPRAVLVSPSSGVDIYFADNATATADSFVVSGAGNQMLLTGARLIEISQGSTHIHFQCLTQPIIGAKINFCWYG